MRVCLLAYDSQCKAYRVLLAERSMIVVSRGGVLDESVPAGTCAAVPEADKCKPTTNTCQIVMMMMMMLGVRGVFLMCSLAVMLMSVILILLMVAMVVRGVVVLHPHCII
jgi:hypothetical protein